MKRQEAKDLLAHYLELAYERGGKGLTFDADNHAEVECIVDMIIDEAVAEAKRYTDAQLNAMRSAHSLI